MFPPRSVYVPLSANPGHREPTAEFYVYVGPNPLPEFLHLILR